MIDKFIDKIIYRAILFIGISLGFTLLHANNFFFWDSITQISIPAGNYPRIDCRDLLDTQIFKIQIFGLFSYFLILVLSGSFWVYPDKIAQGWDATPAHWPYYSVRNEMLEYLNLNKIPHDKTGSFFPNTASFRVTDLSDNNQSFKDADLEKEEYVLFSNVYNRSDEIIDKLFSDKSWTLEKIIKKRRVYMILFRRVIQNAEKTK